MIFLMLQHLDVHDTQEVRSYGLLAQWLEANQYHIAGTGREILMQLPLREKGDEAIMELQLPVTKRDSSTLFI